MAVESETDRAAFFDTGEFGESVTFYPPDSRAPVTVAMVPSEADESGDVGLSSVVTPARIWLARQSELGDQPVGGVFDRAGERFSVTGATLDETRTIWRLTLKPHRA